MAEHSFTPGPWRVACGVNVFATDSRYVAATSGLEDRVRFGLSVETIDALNDEDAANARLIAAAPDLLEALFECEEYFDNRADADCDQEGFVPNKEMRLLSVVREAIAKAEGRS